MSLKLPEKTVTPRERGAIPSPYANYILALWIMCLSRSRGVVVPFQLSMEQRRPIRRNTLDYLLPLTSNFGMKSDLVPECPTAYSN